MTRVWAWTGWALAVGAAVYAQAQRQSYQARFEQLSGTAEEYLRLAAAHAGESGRRADHVEALRELVDYDREVFGTSRFELGDIS